jgi:enamine deaminase RidA (YjgF/YER057c/UK114 family)
MGNVQRLGELGITLPTLVDNPESAFALGSIAGSYVHLSGQIPVVEGKCSCAGLVGSSVTVEQAREGARICVLNLLAALQLLIGDLDQVKRVVKVNGYVACEKDFIAAPSVINAASDLLNEIFGKANRHARVAMGVASLPFGASVEVEMIVELEGVK